MNPIRRVRVSPGLAYLLAVLLPTVSLLLRLALSSRFGDDPALELFLVPIILSAYAGGLGPGLVTTALVAVVTDYFLLPPKHSLSIQNGAQSIEWLVLILAGALISVLLRRPLPSSFRGGVSLDKEAPDTSRDLPTGLSRTIVICAGSICVALGAVTLLGWFFHIVALTRVGPSFNPMVVNSAAGLLLDGLTLLFLAAGRPKAALPGAVWSLLVGMLTLAEYGFSISFHIDELLARDYIHSMPAYPGRPAPNAAICLALCGVALLWAAIPRWRNRATTVIGVLGAVVFAMGAAAVCGYLIGLPLYALGDSKPMAANAGLGFLALGVGVMALAGFHQQSSPDQSSLVWAEWKVRTGLALALGILIVIGGLAYFSLVRVREERLWVDHTHQVVASLRQVLSTVAEAEAAVRGYVITGNQEFPEPYQKAISNVGAELGALRSLTADNRVQQGRLDALEPLVAQRLFLLQETVELRRKQGFGAARQHVASGRGQQLHDLIRALLAEMEATEQSLLQERAARARHASTVARTAIIGGITLAFTIVVVALFVISRDFAGSRQARAALEEAHDLLELRVQERTAQLKTAAAVALEGELRLNGVIKSAMDAIITVDEHQTIVLFNPAAEKMFGRHDTDVIGQSLDVCIPERFHASHAAHHHAFGETGISQRQMGQLGWVFGLRANGEEFPIEASISRVDLGGRKLLTAILRDVTERMRTEEALRRQAELFDQAYDATFVWDWGGAITFWNRGAERLYGYSRAEAVGKDPHTLLQVPVLGAEPTFLAPLKETGNWEGELEHTTRDGRRITVDSRMNLVSYGEHTYILETTRDITERKRSEAALRESEERLRALVNASSDVLYRMSPDWSEMHQLDGRGFIADTATPTGDWLRLYIHPDDQPLVNRTIQNAICDKSVFELEHRVRQTDGSLGWTLSRAVPRLDAHGEIIEWFGMASDVTRRKSAEEALRESEERLQKVTDRMTEGLIISTSDGELVHWNPSAMQMHGFTTREEWHRHLPEFKGIFELSTLDGKDVPFEEWPLARILRGERLRELELRVRRLDKDWQRVFSYGGTTIENSQGKEMGFLTVSDITERKRAEQEIQLLNEDLERRVAARTAELEAAVKELESFSYSVAHDLRAPLRTLDGFSGAVLEDYGPQLPEQGREYLQTIRRGAQRMGALIDDLLTFSRLGRKPVAKQSVNMEALVRGALEELGPECNGKRIQFVNSDLPPAQGDPALLKQVWLNLLSNAIKYSRHAEQARIEVGSLAEPGAKVYFVRDNGAGFDMKYADKLFGVFQRLHRADEFEGTGIGLATVQRIVHRHGGRVWAEAQPDQGATFYFTLEGEI